LVLAGRDASDVPMLLAGVIAPVVIIRTDADGPGRQRARGRRLDRPTRGPGDVGVTKGRMADLERQASVFANLSGHLIRATMEQFSEPACDGESLWPCLVWFSRRLRMPAVTVMW
jgi:hypothetical protein